MNKIELNKLHSFKDYACVKYVLRISAIGCGPVEKTGFCLTYEVNEGYYLPEELWITMPKTIGRM